MAKASSCQKQSPHALPLPPVGFVDIPSSLIPVDVPSGKLWACDVHGESLEGYDLEDGDIVLFRSLEPDEQIESGSVVCVRLNSDTRARFFHTAPGDRVRLSSRSTDGAVYYRKTDVEILGIFVAHIARAQILSQCVRAVEQPNEKGGSDEKG
jgi:SOS-response transcriptional repressor LexA